MQKQTISLHMLLCAVRLLAGVECNVSDDTIFHSLTKQSATPIYMKSKSFHLCKSWGWNKAWRIVNLSKCNDSPAPSHTAHHWPRLVIFHQNHSSVFISPFFTVKSWIFARWGGICLWEISIYFNLHSDYVEICTGSLFKSNLPCKGL